MTFREYLMNQGVDPDGVLDMTIGESTKLGAWQVEMSISRGIEAISIKMEFQRSFLHDDS